MKIKNFYNLKDLVRRMERQTIGWEKILANLISDKEFTHSEYIKNSQNSIRKNKNGQITNFNTSLKKLYRWQIST